MHTNGINHCGATLKVRLVLGFKVCSINRLKICPLKRVKICKSKIKRAVITADTTLLKGAHYQTLSVINQLINRITTTISKATKPMIAVSLNFIKFLLLYAISNIKGK